MLRSSFFEFNVATSALFTAQSNLKTTMHNVANANTRGYSKQYGVTRANTPMPGLGTGMYGTGSSVVSIKRLRNDYLDNKYWKTNPTSGEYSVKSTKMKTIESIVNELNDAGITTSMNTVFDTLQDLSTNPGDMTYRNNLISAMTGLTEQIETIGREYEEQQKDLNAELKNTVSTINSLGKQIATLNQQIKFVEMNGDTANDLRDQRIVLVDELSKYVNVNVSEVEKNPNYDPKVPGSISKKEFKVQINGVDFITGENVNTLQCEERTEKLNPNDVDGLYDIYFTQGHNKFNIYSSTLKGELKGLVDIRDGNNSRSTLDPSEYGTGDKGETNMFGETYYATTSYKGIPHMMEKLNQLARTIAMSFNEGLNSEGQPITGVVGHVNGYDLSGNGSHLLFSYKDGTTGTTQTDVTLGTYAGTLKNGTETYLDYSQLSYKNFKINPDIVKDNAKLSMSASPVADQSANAVALGFLEIKNDVGLFAEGRLSDYIVGMTSEIAVTTSQASKFALNYADNMLLIDNQRMESSGVNLDEEMIDYAKFEQMFQAASKLINSIDGVYDTIINKMGTGF